MYSKEQIKSKLKDIFVEATLHDPFVEDEYYHLYISVRFELDILDVMEIIMRIEKEFRIHLSPDEDEKLGLMSIDEIVSFVATKCSVGQANY